LEPGTPFAPPPQECTSGATWNSAWRNQGIKLEVRLVASFEGAESCWFTGNVSVEQEGTKWSAAIKGACGC
jgi:hypothetical protein